MFSSSCMFPTGFLTFTNQPQGYIINFFSNSHLFKSSLPRGCCARNTTLVQQYSFHSSFCYGQDNFKYTSKYLHECDKYIFAVPLVECTLGGKSPHLRPTQAHGMCAKAFRCLFWPHFETPARKLPKCCFENIKYFFWMFCKIFQPCYSKPQLIWQEAAVKHATFVPVARL